MQIIRTVLWVLITAVLVAFIAMNWTKVPVNFWPLTDGNYLHFEWPVGVVALAFFLLGAVPMWLVHRAGRWRLQRRIHALENTVASSSPGIVAPSEAVHAATPLSAPVLENDPVVGLHQERSQI